MADPAKLAKLRRNRQGVINDAPVVSEPQNIEDRLDNPEAQREILEPEVQSIKIGGKEYILHKLSAKRGREFTGLVQQVFVETFAGKTEATETLPRITRMAGIVSERFADRFLPFLAYATGEPGEVSQSDAERLAAQFDDRITYPEQTLAFVVLVNMNGVLKTLSPETSSKK